MQPLSQAQVGPACSAWLQALGSQLADLRTRVLGSCTQAAHLAGLEAAVKEGLGAWLASDAPDAALPSGEAPAMSQQCRVADLLLDRGVLATGLACGACDALLDQGLGIWGFVGWGELWM